MAVILIAIGLFLTGIDIYGVSAWGYPAFHLEGAVGSHELSESIRTYTVTNVLGEQVRIDYLPDVLGCVFLLVGVCMLLRYNRQYLYSIPLILLTAVLSVFLRVSGFLVQDLNWLYGSWCYTMGWQPRNYLWNILCSTPQQASQMHW